MATLRAVSIIVVRMVILFLAVSGAISIYVDSVPYNDAKTLLVNLAPVIWVTLLTIQLFVCSYIPIR